MQVLFVTHTPSPKHECYADTMHPGGRPTNKPRSPIGQRLAEARERAGISQVQLAALLQTNQQTIAYWERHGTWFRSDILIKLTQILGVSSDELLGIKPPRSVATKPIGKARRLFDAVSKLPRRQQEKIAEVVEALVEKQTNGH